VNLLQNNSKSKLNPYNQGFINRTVTKTILNVISLIDLVTKRPTAPINPPLNWSTNCIQFTFGAKQTPSMSLNIKKAYNFKGLVIMLAIWSFEP